MLKRYTGIILSLMLAALVLTAGCGGDQKGNQPAQTGAKVVLKLAENQPDSNPVTIGDQEFAKLVEQKTQGRVKVDVYANAQLGQETETIEQVKAGVLEMARVNSVPLGDMVKEMGVFAMPYIFTNDEQKYKALDGQVGQDIAKAAEKQNMKVLAYLDAGTRHFYTTKKEVKSLADMKGLKIRVQPSKVMLRMVELLGAKATPMNYGEVYSALQTGVIDGAENDFVSYKTASHNEVAKNMSLDGHLSPPAVLLINKGVFEKLSAADQKAVMEAAKEAAQFERKLMMETNAKFQGEVEKSGTKIFKVDVTEFQKAVQPLYDEYPQYKEIIEKIKAVK